VIQAEDVVAVAVVQSAYGVAIDERDWSALRACFAEHASIGFGRPARTGGLDEFLDWAPAFHAELGDTLHQLSTHRVRFDGDAATASCAVRWPRSGSAPSPCRADDRWRCVRSGC
jgi:SnoaL-like domain